MPSFLQPANVLAVTYGAGHVAMLLPVLEILRQAAVGLSVVGLTTAREPLERAGFSPLGFRHLLRDDDLVPRAHGERLTAQLAVDSPIARDESVAYLGLSYADLEMRLGVKEAAVEFQRIGRQAFLPISPMRRLFNRCQPDVVLITNSPRAELAALHVANERSIPCIKVLDLYGTDPTDPEPAARYCVPCSVTADNLHQRGVPFDRIAITGNPNFERHLHNVDPASGSAWRTAHGIAAETTLILYTMQPPLSSADDSAAVIESCLRFCCDQSKDVRIAVRPHPNQPVTLAESVVASLGKQGLLAAADSLSVLLQACDVLVTSTSTTALEAAMQGKRVVVMGDILNQLPYGASLHHYGWATFARDAHAGQQLLLADRDSPTQIAERREQMLRTWRCDGRAAERIAEQVLAFCPSA